MIAAGKAKVSFVLPEKLIDRVRHRAIDQKMNGSSYVEKLLSLGLKAEAEERKEAKAAGTVNV